MHSISLKYKFLIGVITFVTVLGFAVMIFIPVVLSGKLEKELRTTAVYLTKDIAQECVDPILTERAIDLQLLLLTHKETYEDIEYIFVLSGRGEILAHTFADEFPADLIDANLIEPDLEYRIQHLTTKRGGIIDVAAPVLNVELGVIHVGFSERHVTDSVESITRLIRWIIMVVLIIGGGIALLSARALTKPIFELKAGVDAIGGGDLEYRVHIKTKDEIGNLAESFNQMAENLKTAKEELEKSNVELNEALNKVKTLSGMLPICSYCKKIRDDKGYWNQVADYISEHSEVVFTHGMCPECGKRLYKEFFGKDISELPDDDN